MPTYVIKATDGATVASFEDEAAAAADVQARWPGSTVQALPAELHPETQFLAIASAERTPFGHPTVAFVEVQPPEAINESLWNPPAPPA